MKKAGLYDREDGSGIAPAIRLASMNVPTARNCRSHESYTVAEAPHRLIAQQGAVVKSTAPAEFRKLNAVCSSTTYDPVEIFARSSLWTIMTESEGPSCSIE